MGCCKWLNSNPFRFTASCMHDDVVYCRYYEVVYILFHAEMRISGFCGLMLKVVNLENRTVNIDREHRVYDTS